MRSLFLFLLLPAALGAAAVDVPDPALQGFSLVARDDCGKPGEERHLVTGDDYAYPVADLPASKVPAADPTRTVSFSASAVVYRYAGLRPEAQYKLRLTYLSEHQGRVQTLSAGGKPLHGPLPLPDGQVVTRVVTLRAESYRDGKVELEFRRQAGPNAVVSLIELWSNVPTLTPRLEVAAGPDLHGRLEGTVTDIEGAPAAGAALHLTVEGTALLPNAPTDAAGRFVLAIPAAWRAHREKRFVVTAQAGEVRGETSLSGAEAILALPRLTPCPVPAVSSPPNRVELSGTWRFHPQPPEGFEQPESATREGWSDIQVPGEWTMQGFTVPAEGAAGYRRTFAMPIDWLEGRVKLRCDAVYSDATVWVNGREAGRHQGGFTPFELDVTGLVRPGENTLALAVKNASDADRLASGSQYAAHPLGGITRKLSLFSVPPLNVAGLQVTTALDKRYRNATLNVLLEVANEGNRPVTDARVRFSLAGSDGKSVPLRPSTVKLPALAAGETLSQQIALPVADPAKWDPEHPNLYRLSASLESAGKPTEQVTRRFGFRQIEVRGNQVLVNGRPIKLHGACRHETHPVYGRALGAASAVTAPPGPPHLGGAESLWKKDARLFRDANVNFIRTSHYPPAEEFLDACDEMGIWVEDEAPFCWAPGDRREDRLLTAQETLEMVQRDRSHPCVLLWSIANESKWGPNFQASADLVHQADPTRPRIFSYGAVDVASWHYPGPGGPERAANAKQPTLFDEYCHLNAYNREEIVADPGVRDEWGRAIAPMWEKMYASKGCLGGSIWAGIDDVFDLPQGKSVGYGEWGPLDGWRRAKPEYWHLRKAYSPVRVLDAVVSPPPAPGRPLRVRVLNRHDFTNLKELRIEWQLGEAKGTARADVAPHTEGVVTVPLPEGSVGNRRLALRFLSPQGFAIEEVELPLGLSAAPKLPAAPAAAEKPALSETVETFVVKAGRAVWSIDRKTGELRGEVNGRRVLEGGPELMLLPLKGGPCATTFDRSIQPFNACCANWQATAVTAQSGTDAVTVRVEGRYAEAQGSYTLSIDSSGRLSVGYRFTAGAKVDPRQIGLVFRAAKACTTLAWERDAQWSVYPPDHIGRPRGQTDAMGVSGVSSIYKPREEPTWPWSQDQTPWGTNDFRATRRNIRWASLTARGIGGVRVASDGKQHFRAWLQSGRPSFLVAEYDNGGGEGFISSHFAFERRALAPGAVIEGTVRLDLLPPGE